MRALLLSAAVVAAAAASPVGAKDKDPVFVESAAVKDKPAVTFDPAKAYVLMRSEAQTPLYLMKVPTAEDQAAYDRMRSEALAKAQEKYRKKLANYERDLAAAKAAKTSTAALGDRPVEPTDANFQFTPFNQLAAVGIGPINRFAKAGVSTYLHEVTPGTYRVYGFLGLMGNAMMGSCFCMGSVQFDAKPGVITDMGVVGKTEPVKAPSGDSSYPTPLSGEGLFVAAGPDMPIDPRLASQTVVRANFRPAGKLPNYFGLTITRIPEIPGVLRYDRDRIVDLTRGN
ncbi:hypothetical protein ASE86_10495 [Sphingomonas sp. Leaf33]|uniref:hypothetical protein n=1 Tax=Sphingomonas sp. Leaf33 TaxID=1736215 RepID=UPI0006FCC198|nr:hypothetical protein [Sphingomonas sp. Leaf33]KQN26518.1 hypothetical protein ASE86_10495 [Sphingomonas sp. Leaf33]